VRIRTTAPAAKIGTTDFAAMADGCFLSLRDDYRESLAAHLGVSVDSLVKLSVGWSTQNDAFTFPMRDSENNFVGIRLRGRDGRKWSVRGGREGLFMSHWLDADPLLVCEGPTDTAALMDLGFTAVGRPSCTGGTQLVLDLVRASHWDKVVIVADDDPPGWSGAQRLAHKLLPEMRKVKIVTPPAGVKDAREWKRQGATRDDVLAAIDAALSLELRVAQGVAL
jgi:5S rRNA maturation endonuclease (ribonuclease M5)